MRSLVFAMLLSPGCFAAVGPTIGISTSDASPTIGWETSASVLGFGQSFAASTGGWRRRTYLVLEPRLGREIGASNNFVGAGVTLGWRWDTVPGDEPSRQEGFIGGGFAGGAHVMPSNGGDARPYFSIGLGLRGDEIYLAPKIGFFDPPDISVSLH